MFVIPLFGLSAIDLHGAWFESVVIVACTGLAASGLGNLLGTAFRTQQQAAATGAILIIILAALGGIWVPIFAMPEWLQNLSMISPLNWSMSAFQDVLLKDGSWREIIPEIFMLLVGSLLFVVSSLIVYNQRTR